MDVKYQDFHQKLTHLSRLNLQLIINENRSTMVSVLDKTRKAAKVSIHRMFLNAPVEVLSAIADFIKGRQKKKTPSPSSMIQDYIQSHLDEYNYSHLLKKDKLIHQGDYYHLKHLYDEINAQYFNKELELNITWYGHKEKTKSFQVTFGQYIQSLNLIKIHKVLDCPKCPLFFIKFVIYHEILHEIFPPFVDKKGINRIHGDKFKTNEKKFKEYKQAKAWEQEHRLSFFK